MANKKPDLQKILVGGAAGAVIGGAATYAATHQKQTKKALQTIAKKADETVKRIDTEKVKELSEAAFSRLQRTQPAQKAHKKLTNGASKAIKNAKKTVGRKTR